MAGENLTEILQHRIRWWLRGNAAPTELDETSVEHITKLITEGYNQGELCISGVPDDKTGVFEEFRGWWSIDKS